MLNQTFSSIPVELMELLNRINDNVNEVKERLARLEGQDHSESIRNLRNEIDKARDERILMRIDIANIKTRLAPLVIAISMIGGAAIQVIFKSF